MSLYFYCNYCPSVLPHFKALIEHCKEHHPEVLRRYQITNKKLKQTILWEFESAEGLCKVFGWDIKDCKITIIKEI